MLVDWRVLRQCLGTGVDYLWVGLLAAMLLSVHGGTASAQSPEKLAKLAEERAVAADARTVAAEARASRAEQEVVRLAGVEGQLRQDIGVLQEMVEAGRARNAENGADFARLTSDLNAALARIAAERRAQAVTSESFEQAIARHQHYQDAIASGGISLDPRVSRAVKFALQNRNCLNAIRFARGVYNGRIEAEAPTHAIGATAFGYLVGLWSATPTDSLDDFLGQVESECAADTDRTLMQATSRVQRDRGVALFITDEEE